MENGQPQRTLWHTVPGGRCSAILSSINSKQQVLVSNQNIKQAEAQYRQARALVSEVQSDYLPTVTDESFRHPEPSALTSITPTSTWQNIFDLPVTASWEPDLWGAVTFAVRTAKAEAQASAAQLEGMRLSMQAELAADYFSLAAIDMQSALLDSATASYEKALKLTLARFNAGIASQADVAQARTQLDSTHAQATDLGITRAQLEHAIAVLVGQAPATFHFPPCTSAVSRRRFLWVSLRSFWSAVQTSRPQSV